MKNIRRPRAEQTGTLIALRLQPELLERVDAWLGTQIDAPSRPEAIRRVLDKHLPISREPVDIAAIEEQIEVNRSGVPRIKRHK